MKEFKNKKYLDLFLDSLIAFDAATSMSGNRAGSLYRSAIVSSVVSLECAANICIDDLELPEDIYVQIEKFAIPAKFDYFAHVRSGRLIDKSKAEYSFLKTIISIRNDYVHPKVETGSLDRQAFDVFYGIKKPSLFDNDIRKWGKREAEIIIDSGIKFLNYFFLEVCGMSRGMVTNMLSCREVLNSKNIDVFIHLGGDMHLLNHLKTSIDFLDLRDVAKHNKPGEAVS
jgi:hypothetical protein